MIVCPSTSPPHFSQFAKQKCVEMGREERKIEPSFLRVLRVLFPLTFAHVWIGSRLFVGCYKSISSLSVLDITQTLSRCRPPNPTPPISPATITRLCLQRSAVGTSRVCDNIFPYCHSPFQTCVQPSADHHIQADRSLQSPSTPPIGQRPIASVNLPENPVVSQRRSRGVPRRVGWAKCRSTTASRTYPLRTRSPKHTASTIMTRHPKTAHGQMLCL